MRPEDNLDDPPRIRELSDGPPAALAAVFVIWFAAEPTLSIIDRDEPARGLLPAHGYLFLGAIVALVTYLTLSRRNQPPVEVAAA